MDRLMYHTYRSYKSKYGIYGIKNTWYDGQDPFLKCLPHFINGSKRLEDLAQKPILLVQEQLP